MATETIEVHFLAEKIFILAKMYCFWEGKSLAKKIFESIYEQVLLIYSLEACRGFCLDGRFEYFIHVISLIGKI